MIRKYWLIWTTVGVLLLGPILSALSSEKFKYCEDHQGNYPTVQRDEKNAPVVLIPRTGAMHIFLSCSGGFANDNGGAITGLATVLLTIVTGGLVFIGYLQIQTTRRQLRAYIFAESGTMVDGSMLTPPQPANFNRPGITLIFKNTGQSPAKDILSWIEIDVVEPRHEETLVIPPLQRKYALSIGAGGTWPKNYWFKRALNAQEIADIQAGTKNIYVYGRVEYVDIFGERHFTNFRYFYQGQFPFPGGMTFNTSDGGNGFN